MKAELKKRWVEALRSGEYQQVFGRYSCEDGYCALGVVMDLLDAPTLNQSFLLMSEQVDKDCKSEVLIMNDDERKSFTVIADWIEENVKGEA